MLEVFNALGESIAVVTVKVRSDVGPLQADEVLAVRHLGASRLTSHAANDPAGRPNRLILPSCATCRWP